MTNFATLTSILLVLAVVVPALLAVAYVTVAERKTMASMQRRLGPNTVGFWGSLQAFADALKLLLKEYVSPTQANIILFFLGPVITLVFSLLGYGVIPYGPGLTIWDFDLGILYMLAVSSLATYGILLAGWSANSKYAFLGALRSTAQLISYELILSSAILIVILLTGSLSLTVNTEFQRIIWFTLPLLPIFIIFFIGSVAETNRAPFDLAEAESELVSGFMTEHAAVIFVFFFLAEYGSILLICILNAILFLGGYIYYNIIFNDSIMGIYNYIDNGSLTDNLVEFSLDITNYPSLEGLLYGNSLGNKASIMVFTFIWVRASFPRIRYDQLMTYSWTMLLPIVIAFIILFPSNVFNFEIVPTNFALLFFWPFKLNNNKAKAKFVSIIITGIISTVMFLVFKTNLIALWELDLANLLSNWEIKTSIIFLLFIIKGFIQWGIENVMETYGPKYLFGPYTLDNKDMLGGPDISPSDYNEIDKLKKKHLSLKPFSDESTDNSTPEATPEATSSDESRINPTPEATPSDESRINPTPEATPEATASDEKATPSDNGEATSSEASSDDEGGSRGWNDFITGFWEYEYSRHPNNAKTLVNPTRDPLDPNYTPHLHDLRMSHSDMEEVKERFKRGDFRSEGLSLNQEEVLFYLIRTENTDHWDGGCVYGPGCINCDHGDQQSDNESTEADSNSSDNGANPSDNGANTSDNRANTSDNGANKSDNASTSSDNEANTSDNAPTSSDNVPASSDNVPTSSNNETNP